MNEPSQAPAVPSTHEQPTANALPVRFTGTGAEYFRIWIVNLLLTLVTLTLYLPFARARRIRYFQNHTLVGDDPLGFHADPWRMFRGYLVVLVLGIAYFVITNFLPHLGWIAVVALMVAWPWLWRASLQFRLRNTSWRGVRFRFHGDLAPAYAVMAPLFLPALALVIATAGMPSNPEEMSPDAAANFMVIFSATMLLTLLLGPWLFMRLKRYQHSGYGFTQQRTHLSGGDGRFYVICIVTALLTALIVAAFSVLMMIPAALAAPIETEVLNYGTETATEGEPSISLLMVMFYGALTAGMYLLVASLAGSYFASRTQNLLWNNTRSQKIQFRSALTWGDLLAVTAVNWLLIVLTLGLYWPWARVRSARVRLNALTVMADGDIAEWTADMPASERGALGDAAGDYMGFDIGL